VISACDVVIAADNALFLDHEVRWGLTAAIIIPQLLRRHRRPPGSPLRADRRRFGAETRAASASCMKGGAAGGTGSRRRQVVEQLLANGPAALAETKGAGDGKFVWRPWPWMTDAYAAAGADAFGAGPDIGGVRRPRLVRQKARGEVGSGKP